MAFPNRSVARSGRYSQIQLIGQGGCGNVYRYQTPHEMLAALAPPGPATVPLMARRQSAPWHLSRAFLLMLVVGLASGSWTWARTWSYALDRPVSLASGAWDLAAGFCVGEAGGPGLYGGRVAI
ncbi:MAG: hypothetical protein HGA65_12780 [Oscillochloris sp.]|nr:hypothetical protein [Oscillochloris sp.]